MTIGSIREIVQKFKQKFTLLCDNISVRYCDKLLDLLQCFDNDAKIDKALTQQIEETIKSFWEEISQEDSPSNWATHPRITHWLILSNSLEAYGVDINRVHYTYFFHNFLIEFQKQDEEKLTTAHFIPLLISCCRMMAYARENELNTYLEIYIQKNQQYIEARKNTHLIPQFKTVITSLHILFYLFYHHLNDNQIALLPLLIKYRPNTTDEEIRSETALIAAFNDNPEACLDLFKQVSHYVDYREFQENSSLAALKNIVPNSRTRLLEQTIGKSWYYVATKSNRSCKPKDLVHKPGNTLETDFSLQSKKSYLDAFNFSSAVLEQSLAFKPFVRQAILSASYVFCLQHYMTVCTPSTDCSSFFTFSHKTKRRAAQKLLQQENGEVVQFTTKEWAATKEGRLGKLTELFNNYKEEHAQRLTIS